MLSLFNNDHLFRISKTNKINKAAGKIYFKKLFFETGCVFFTKLTFITVVGDGSDEGPIAAPKTLGAKHSLGVIEFGSGQTTGGNVGAQTTVVGVGAGVSIIVGINVGIVVGSSVGVRHVCPVIVGVGGEVGAGVEVGDGMGVGVMVGVGSGSV